MRVLLLSPEFPDTFWSFRHALGFIGKRAPSPPLGLLTVAAMLPRDWEARLVDLNVRRLADADLAWADCAFVSAMTVQRPSAREVIARCRAAGVKVVAGGPLFTAEHDDFPEVDHFVLNEAELTLGPFLEDLAAGRARRLYATGEFADLSHTPVPAWRLAERGRYAMMSVQYSRGCPFNCEFCNVTALLGRRPRIKSVAQIIAELDGLYALGWRQSIFFVDDNLIGNRARLKSELLPALIAWRRDKRGLPFVTEASINLADDEDLTRMMVEAGFDTVFVGIETPDDVSLAECGKQQNRRRDLVADVKRLQRAGLQVQAGFIVGFDSDTPTCFQRLVDFIQDSGIATAMVGLLQAPPGTLLHERLRQSGRIRERMSGDNVDGTTNIVPIMDLESLRAGYRSVLRRIYAPEAYYRRIRTFLREYRPPRLKGEIGPRHLLTSLRTLWRSTYRLGFLGRERLHYWRMFVWTLVRRPRSLPMAITLAITGYHFRRIAEVHGR